MGKNNLIVFYELMKITKEYTNLLAIDYTCYIHTQLRHVGNSKANTTRMDLTYCAKLHR